MIKKITLSDLVSVLRRIFTHAQITSVKQTMENNSYHSARLNIQEKEKHVYGENSITQQKLYEKWAIKKSWHLKNQAIPLLLGIDPENLFVSSKDEVTEQKHLDLCKHAQHCVEQGLLSVINRESPIDEWQVEPIDIYRWASISRVKLPEQLSTLMEFIVISMPDITLGSFSDKQYEINHEKDKEYILGAALAMLVTYPEQCRDKNKCVKAEKIISLISKYKNILFGHEIPYLSTTIGLELIERWIRRPELRMRDERDY